eukprot:3931611-Ditylum_brightwellii.AAC.1
MHWISSVINLAVLVSGSLHILPHALTCLGMSTIELCKAILLCFVTTLMPSRLTIKIKTKR